MRPDNEVVIARIVERKRQTRLVDDDPRDPRSPGRRPTVTHVADSSVVVAALVATGDDGTWATSLLASQPIAAPHLMPVEVANVLRRAARAGNISDDIASLAHGDLLQLRCRVVPLRAVRRARMGPPREPDRHTTGGTSPSPRPWACRSPHSTSDSFVLMARGANSSTPSTGIVMLVPRVVADTIRPTGTSDGFT